MPHAGRGTGSIGRRCVTFRRQPADARCIIGRCTRVDRRDQLARRSRAPVRLSGSDGASSSVMHRASSGAQRGSVSTSEEPRPDEGTLPEVRGTIERTHRHFMTLSTRSAPVYKGALTCSPGAGDSDRTRLCVSSIRETARVMHGASPKAVRRRTS